MADPTPAPEPDLAPPATDTGPAAPPGTIPVAKTAPSKQRPVVLATPLLQRFVVPGEGENGADLDIGPAGAALTRKQADHVEQLAAAAGVRLLDITPDDAPDKD